MPSVMMLLQESNPLFFENSSIKFLRITIEERLQTGIYLLNCWVASAVYGICTYGLAYIRFSSVSDRFIEFLEKYRDGVIPKDQEGSVENVIRGMTYLKIKVGHQISQADDRYTQWMR